MAKIAVVCLTYNHGHALSACLDSILDQDIIHDVEIILHDDASNDGSVQIIKEYSRRYPDTITPILQLENQYSRGVNILMSFILPNLNADYVAFCEGDDFWTDRQKLSLQLSKLEGMEEIDACFHRHLNFDNLSQKFSGSSQRSYGTVDRPVGGREFIWKGSGSIATNSLMIRAETFRDNLWRFKNAPTTDYYLKLSGFFQNKNVYFIGRTMSAYRVNVNGSWSQRAKAFEEFQLTRLLLRHYLTHSLLLGRMPKMLIVLSSVRLTAYITRLLLRAGVKPRLPIVLLKWIFHFAKHLFLLFLGRPPR